MCSNTITVAFEVHRRLPAVNGPQRSEQQVRRRDGSRRRRCGRRGRAVVGGDLKIKINFFYNENKDYK